MLSDPVPSVGEEEILAPAEGRINVDPQGDVLCIVIDRPRKLNGFSVPMLRQLGEAYTTLDRDPRYRCGLLMSSGNAFTAGLELDAIWPRMLAGEPLFPAEHVDPLALRAPYLRKPLVCAVEGLCFTLGIELMLAADIAVAGEDARFAQVEVGRGIMPIGGATMRMVERAGWGNAQRYLLTGDEFNAQEALRMGLVQEVVATGSAKARGLQLAETIARQAPLAVEASLASSRLFARRGFDAAASELAIVQAALMRSADAAEGKLSFQQRRPGRFQGR